LRAAVAAPIRQARESLIGAIDRPQRVAPAARRQAQMLVDRQAAPDAAALRHVADAEARDLVRLQVRDLAPQHGDGAAARPLQPDDSVA
jgi:hypothetical protein